MRLFVALDIEDGVRARIARFMEGVQNFAPEARWAKEASLHVTLKFIGEQPESSLDEIKRALASTTGKKVRVVFRGYGFFPTARSARVFWIGMEAGPELAGLASEVDAKLKTLGIPEEKRTFTPHLTLARRAGGSGAPDWRGADGSSRTFQRLQEKLASLPAPDFGSMTAHEFFLYQSRLSPKGSSYTKLAKFDLA